MNIDGILKELEAYSNEFTTEVVMTASKQVKRFRPINVLQQKNIISAVASNSLDNIKIVNILNNIIIQNCCDETEDINVIDRELILAALKVDVDSDIDLKRLNNQIKEADFNAHLSKFNFDKKIDIELQVPTIMRDIKLNEWFISTYASKNLPNAAAASNYYVLELVKYIKKLEVLDDAIDFHDAANYSSLFKITEKLPSAINSAITKFITANKKNIELILADNNITTRTPLF